MRAMRVLERFRDDVLNSVNDLVRNVSGLVCDLSGWREEAEAFAVTE